MPIAEETVEELKETEENIQTNLNEQNKLNDQQNFQQQQKHRRIEAIPILERHKRQQQEKQNKNKHFVFPGSGTGTAYLQVTQQSNIGIPGEWLLRIDQSERIYLCGAGFQGLGYYFLNI